MHILHSVKEKGIYFQNRLRKKKRPLVNKTELLENFESFTQNY